MMIKYGKVIILFLLAMNIGLGQFSFFRSDAFEKRFNQGVEAYKQHQYYQAYKQFNRNYLSGNFNHPQTTANFFMLIKSLFKLGDYDSTLDLIRQFQARFPGSSYNDDLKLILSEVFLKREEYSIALQHLLNTIDQSSDKRIKKRAYMLAGKVLDNFFLPDKLEQLRDGSLNIHIYTFLTLKLADKLIREGNYLKASRELKKVSSSVKETPWQADYIKLQKRLLRPVKKSVTIGIILPLSGPMAEIGLDLLRGIQLSISDHQSEIPYSVNTIVLDNEGDNLNTVRQVRYLAKNPDVLAVIGPVSSDNTVAAAGVATGMGIPLISPTATRNDVASLGETIYQANVDLESRGRAIAKFAMNHLGLNTFAILSPADQYGKNLTDAFASTVDLYGGKVLTEQWFQGSPENLGPQFKRIREAGFELLREKQRLADTLSIAWDTTYGLPYINYSFMQNPEDELLDEEDKKSDSRDVDSLKIMISEIDAIFLPIHDGDIEFVASQYASYYLDSQVLGGGNWYDQKALNEHPGYVDGLIFVSDYFIDTGNPEFLRLDSLYNVKYGEGIKRLTFYGYDTFSVLADALKNRNADRETICEYLNGVSGKAGVIRYTSFKGDRPRVNSSLFILQFKNGQISPLYVMDSDTLRGLSE